MFKRCSTLTIVFLAVGLSAGLSTNGSLAADNTARPNVLWLTCEDISPNLGCYGDEYAITPNLDRLAEEGVRYTHAVGICGVCGVNRSCLITGMYSSTIGSQDMRSRIGLPDSIRTYSELLREAGYYCTNNAKTDYNFPPPVKAWDACSPQAHWRNRAPDQPFFAIFNYTGSHESQIWAQNHQRHAAKLRPDQLHDPAKTPVPPFQPDTPEVRRDWANYYDNITALDLWIDERLREVDKAGLADDTIVFFYSDHGAGMPMCKKWIWDWGLRVPLIIRFPEKYAHLAPSRPGSVCDRLVSFVDFAPTLLSLTGIDIPEVMQGRAFLGDRQQPPREYALAIRDRMAEWHETIRVVRDKRYQYHRNFMPHLSYAPFCSYTLKMPTAQVWAQLHEQGRLDPVRDRYFQRKPTEELYDLETDPHMVHNLADDTQHADVLRRMRDVLHRWQLRTRDLGLMSEFEMHRRAEGSTQYEVGQSEASYPLERILPIAEMASRRDPANRDRLVTLLKDEEPIVRWWAALGLLMLGHEAIDARAAIKDALDDDSPLVRIAAAESLYGLGEVDQARATLIDALKHRTPFVRLRAIGALYRMGDDARLALPAINAAGMKGIYPAEYLNRMVNYLPKRLRAK
jgi:uncharacterized sulfatase